MNMIFNMLSISNLKGFYNKASQQLNQVEKTLQLFFHLTKDDNFICYLFCFFMPHFYTVILTFLRMEKLVRHFW